MRRNWIVFCAIALLRLTPGQAAAESPDALAIHRVEVDDLGGRIVITGQGSRAGCGND